MEKNALALTKLLLEHIPPSKAGEFIDNLQRLLPKYLIDQVEVFGRTQEILLGVQGKLDTYYKDIDIPQ